MINKINCLRFVDKMTELGYNRAQVIQAITENHCNDLTATYMLLKLRINEVWGVVKLDSSGIDGVSFGSKSIINNWITKMQPVASNSL